MLKNTRSHPLGFRRFECYLEKVFAFRQAIEGIRDGRVYPVISLSAILRALFLGTVLRLASVHEVERECRRGKLHPQVGSISEDTLRYALERVQLDSLRAMWVAIVKRLKRNGILTSSLAGGRICAAVDGIEIFCSFSRCCEQCLKRTVMVKREEQEYACVQYYHRIVVVSLVGLSFAVPLGLELMQPGEDEVACAKRLLARLRASLGPRFFDLLTMDALYLRPEFVARVEAWGWNWVTTLKENQAELLAEAKQWTLGRKADWEEVQGPKSQLWLWKAPQTYWDTARRTVRVVRAVEERVESHRVGQQKISQTKRSENFWVTALPEGKVSTISVHRAGKARWEVETRLFADMTLHWFLKHAAIHSPVAFEALLLIRFMAYLLFMVFLHRQVYSHLRDRLPSLIEVARWLYNSLGPVAPPRLDSS